MDSLLIEKLQKAINSVDVLIGVLSRASVNSPWVKKELAIAVTREIKHKRLKVIPLLLHNVHPPVFLEDKLYADFTTTHRQKVNFPKLLKTIREQT